jgi:hypothetical protein
MFPEYSAQTLDHSGIVASICQQINTGYRR